MIAYIYNIHSACFIDQYHMHVYFVRLQLFYTFQIKNLPCCLFVAFSLNFFLD